MEEVAMRSKRAAAEAEEGVGEEEGRVVKKVKGGEEDEGELVLLKRVAEIVLVLAAMGEMRGGGNLSNAEVELMGEARAKLVGVCEGIPPKEVFPREAFGVVMEDLGLSKLKEQQRLGFRPPTMSILEKLEMTKQKMEKSEEFALHSAAYSSQRLQKNVGPAAENCGTSHTGKIFSSEKQSQMPSTSGGFQPASPVVGHVSVPNSSPLTYQLPSSEVRPVSSSGLPSNHSGRETSLLLLARVERPPLRFDVKSSGASNTTHIQANPSGDHIKTPMVSLHPPQSASSHKIVSDNKVTIQALAKGEGASDMSRVISQQKTSKSFMSHPASAYQSSIHQHAQHGVKFVPSPSLGSSHIEIGKIVQKLLQPQLPVHPVWTPPSRDYMDKSLVCQMCKVVVNEVDNVLVCDACEKGYHLKCLQYYNPDSVPRGEWHCGKCLSLSNGKPLPPKYGRVMRNTTISKLSSTPTSVQLSSEKKLETLDSKVNLQRVTANGTSGLQIAPTNTMDNKSSHYEPGGKTVDARVMHGNNTSSSKGKTMGDPSGSGPNNLMRTSVAACFTPVVLSAGKSTEEKLVAETKSQPPAKSETVANTYNHIQAVQQPQHNDQTGFQDSSVDPAKKFPDTNFKVMEIEKSCGGEMRVCNTNDGVKQDGQAVSLANLAETPCTRIGPVVHDGSLSDGLHDFHWVGDVLQVLDEKTYYRSCSINGVLYKVQDHALFRSDDNILTPSKLQGMWEDNKTRSKWVFASRCYFPADLPVAVGRPCAPEMNEVYESNHDSALKAGLIEGPCKVLPPRVFIEEIERRKRLEMEESGGLQPVFVCKWFFDEPKGLFHDVTS